MPATVNIYTLSHPETGRVRYVGKTGRRLKRRRDQHVRRAKKYERPSRCKAWIRAVLEETSERPHIKPIEEVPQEQADQAEKFWIAYLKYLGCNLTNMTPGGEGFPPGYTLNLSDERREELAELCRKYMGNRSPTKEERERMSQTMKKLYSDPENTPWFGKSLSEEHKDEIRSSIGKLDYETAEGIRRRYKEEDTTYKQLAAEYEVSRNAIGKIMRGESYVRPGTKDPPAKGRAVGEANRGENAARAKFTQEEAERIRRRCRTNADVNFTKIAEEKGVSVPTIINIAQGKSYARH